MTFIPINGHIEVKPIVEGGVVQREQAKYEEKGIVINTGAIDKAFISIGDVVFFDGWLAAKYGADTDEEHWLVKYEDIRAIERNT